VLVYCSNTARCIHHAIINVDFLPDDTVLKSLEPRMVCTRCGSIGCRRAAGLGSYSAAPVSQRESSAALQVMLDAIGEEAKHIRGAFRHGWCASPTAGH